MKPTRLLGSSVIMLSLALLGVRAAQPQTPTPVAADAKALSQKIGGLRSVPDAERGPLTKRLALDIRTLPNTPIRLSLASSLANLATEGDFGHDTLQEVATTLADALRAQPPTGTVEKPAAPYVTLAQLVRYEGVRASLPNTPQFAAALDRLAADDKARDGFDFTLTDLQGKTWTRKALRGKVVLVNFWATWCPPCRKEIPDLDALAKRFQSKGLVVLGITDEKTETVKAFVEKQPSMSYPILLDSDRAVNTQYGVQGIPRTFIYGRDGKLAAQSIDMRTEKQFLALLAKAGLR